MFWRQNRSGLSIVILAVSLIGGEALGFALPEMADLWPWIGFLALQLVAAMVGWRLTQLRWLTVALIGLSLAWRSEAARLAVEARAHTLGDDNLPPAYDLTVESGVARRGRSSEGGTIISFQSSLGNIPVRVVARRSRDAALPSIGERWCCRGWLTLRKSATSRYACRTLWVMENGWMERKGAARSFVARRIYRRLSNAFARYAGTGLGWNAELSSLNKAMLLGRRGEVNASRRELFAMAGTMHVFAISGLHVMLVAGLMSLLLAKTGLSPALRSACALPLLAAYVMLSGARPSAVRAALMMGLWLGAGLFGRKPDSLASWGVAALLVYGLAPALVFDAGCALSFAVMLGIVLWIRWTSAFASPLDGLLRRAAEAQTLGEEERKKFFLKWYFRGMWVLGALGISFAAWIASTPIAARIFGRITIGGILANVAVVPLATVSVVLGVAGTVASSVAVPLGAFFNNLAAGCIRLMELLSEWVVWCPGASFETQAWSWRDCGIWYVAWIAFFAVLSRNLPRKEWIPVKTWE